MFPFTNSAEYRVVSVTEKERGEREKSVNYTGKKKGNKVYNKDELIPTMLYNFKTVVYIIL